jgi:hypothetical protein
MVFYLAFFPLTVYVMTSFSELCMPKPALILHLVLTVTLAHLCRGEDILLAKGEKITGEVSGGGGTWRVGSENLRMSEVLCIRFSSDPAPDHIPAGVFIRGGSLITGTLVLYVGANAEIASNVLGRIKIAKDDVACAFFPRPADQTESLAELLRYSDLLAAALGSSGATLQPGTQWCQVAMNGEVIPIDHVNRINEEQVLLTMSDNQVEKRTTAKIRRLEFKVPPPPAPTTDEERLGPEIVVRLRSGDLIRGRAIKLNDKGLTLHTTFMGDQTLERSTLAAIFLAGGKGSNVTWLSSLTPAKSVHTPVFDAQFPAHMDASVEGGNLNVSGFLCERGIGVHSRSQITFNLPGTPSKFVAVCGIDGETKGRGEVSAKVLADGKEVWSVGSLSGKDAPRIIPAIELGTAKTLDLEVDYGADGDDSGDHFDWGWAAIVGK